MFKQKRETPSSLPSVRADRSSARTHTHIGYTHALSEGDARVRARACE